MVSIFLCGISVMFYGQSHIFKLGPSIITLCGALFLSGFINANILVPVMDEMIDVTEPDQRENDQLDLLKNIQDLVLRKAE